MLHLPNSCRCSTPTIFPKNWNKKKADPLIKWYISYRFYDEDSKNGQLIIVKSGINYIKNLPDKQAAIEALLDDEVERLKDGFNPISKKFIHEEFEDYPIPPNTQFYKALKKASKELEVAHTTKLDIKGVLKYLKSAISKLKYDKLEISQVRRRHIRLLLNTVQKRENISDNRYNKVRAYTSMLFNELIQLESIESNPVKLIKKKKVVKRARKLIDEDKLIEIDEYLKSNVYTFWRYLRIFFHSGSRSTELFRLKKEDIDLKNYQFTVTVRKGKNFKQQIRPINIHVYRFWKELYFTSKRGDFIFSKGLEPGKNQISARQITIRWKRHAKDKFGITEDFYLLKHLHSDKVDEIQGLIVASAANGHTTTRMTEDVYAVNHKKRINEILKNIDVGILK